MIVYFFADEKEFLPNLTGQKASISELIASLARVNSEPRMLPDVSSMNTKSLLAVFTASRLALPKQ